MDYIFYKTYTCLDVVKELYPSWIWKYTNTCLFIVNTYVLIDL